MEKIMSKSNDSSGLVALVDHCPLADRELIAVIGGTKATSSGSFFEALARAWGQALDTQAATLSS